MHERKALMEQLADAFVVLPGGYGTFEEMLEVLTWAQLGLHRKPVGLVNTAGYYDGLVGFIDHTLDQDFISMNSRNLLLVEPTPDAVLARLLAG